MNPDPPEPRPQRLLRHLFNTSSRPRISSLTPPDKICSICLTPYMTGPSPEAPLEFTKCGHIHGISCILQWINPTATHVWDINNSCPMCRSPIFPPEMLRIQWGPAGHEWLRGSFPGVARDQSDEDLEDLFMQFMMTREALRRWHERNPEEVLDQVLLNALNAPSPPVGSNPNSAPLSVEQRMRMGETDAGNGATPGRGAETQGGRENQRSINEGLGDGMHDQVEASRRPTSPLPPRGEDSAVSNPTQEPTRRERLDMYATATPAEFIRRTQTCLDRQDFHRSRLDAHIYFLQSDLHRAVRQEDATVYQPPVNPTHNNIEARLRYMETGLSYLHDEHFHWTAEIAALRTRLRPGSRPHLLTGPDVRRHAMEIARGRNMFLTGELRTERLNLAEARRELDAARERVLELVQGHWSRFGGQEIDGE